MSKLPETRVFWCPACGHSYSCALGLLAIARRGGCNRTISLLSLAAWKEEAAGKGLNLTPAGRSALADPSQGGENG